MSPEQSPDGAPSHGKSDLRYPAWQREYQAALVEADPAKLFNLIAEAEVAIFNRLQILTASRDGLAERRAIEEAIATLRVIKKENLAFPDWNSDSGGSQ
jgi:hypothetical protein